MYGVFLKHADLEEVQRVLRRFYITHFGIDSGNSVLIRFKRPKKALQCLTAMELSHLQAEIVFQV